MFSMKDKDYICPYGAKTLEKAKKELHEDPDTRQFEVNNLRKRLQKVPGLKARTDIKFLLSFLRVRKFDQERAFEQVNAFYAWRREKADVFDDLKPSRVRLMLESNIMEVLKDRDSNGCRILIWRAGNWDEDRFPPSEVLKLYSVIMWNLAQSEETQVHGIRFIGDFGKLTLKQGMSMSPSISKFYIHMLQKIIPLRLKRIDYVREPVFFDTIFQLIKPFMNEKLLSRLCMNGDDLSKGLYATLDKDILPTDLGGKVEPYSNTEWKDSILNSEQEFEEDNKFGLMDMGVTSSKKEKKQEDAGLGGLGGTFKKLDV